MTRDETVALFLRGREAWNAWAEKTLAERKTLENQYLETPSNQMRAWMEAATADFSRCHFLVRGGKGNVMTAGEQQQEDELSEETVKSISLNHMEIDFGGFKFPGDTEFQGATFSGRAVFDRATFSGTAGFDSATFTGTAWFKNANFTGDAVFRAATFTGAARFDSATFTGGAVFRSATFAGDAWFQSATFSGTAWFKSATFTGDAWFGSATFQNATNFGDAKFAEGAHFSGIKVQRAFTLTGAAFSLVPIFNQADFKQAPDLDDVRLPLPTFWGRTGADPNWSVRVPQMAKYRAIRRMAIQGADYEREQMAFKGELRSKRGIVDMPWHVRFWLGHLYDGVADCGRSIARPFGVWAASILVFAAFYWWQGANGLAQRCAATDAQPIQALYLSVKNAMVVLGGTRDARVNQAYLCLYGGTPDQPHIPASVTFAETLLQLPMSAALIFLFLLAVKNSYKIK